MEAAGPVIQHDHTGTIVTGTSKDDTELRDALKQTGFHWSRHQNYWYLPRTMNEHTRTTRVSDLRSQLAAHGQDLPASTTPAPDGTTTAPTQAADPGTSTPLSRTRDL